MSEDLTKATARPWSTHPMDDTAVIGPDGEEIAELFADTDVPEDIAAANAALIVVAVNVYEATQARLVKLEAALAAMLDVDTFEDGVAAVQKANAVLGRDGAE